MADEKKTRIYRIGDYAQKMSVTPDLLKHYEKMGLIRARTTESGYRYYPFPESVPLLECLSLRNYGFSLQQMRELLYQGNLASFEQALGAQAEQIRRSMAREQAVLEEYEAQSQWFRRMENRTLYMLLEEKEDVYFLPHSKHHDFLEDDRIQALLSKWVEWMPMVKSCRKIILKSGEDSLRDGVWGLSVPVSLAERFGLPLNSVVERLPGGRHLICHYILTDETPSATKQLWQTITENAQKHGLPLSGPVQQTVLTTLFTPGENVRCGVFSIPVLV
ncbi:MAG: MerR family transcriptional regulator [Clostridia bacterium]|nr:MerR family transcriptional regulator [Clostridia bacterium]